MSDEILMNVTPRETRVAVIENGVLQEVFIERAQRLGLVGNIYKGRICRVLPGMQAAFVEIGLERAAFLHASDITVENQEGSNHPRQEQAISQLVTEGQEIMVQVVKDPLGTKGARLTTQISIPSRYLVFMPRSETTIGISQKIETEDERQRLKGIVAEYLEEGGGGGYIVRTAGEGVSEAVLRKEMGFLRKLWDSIRERFLQAPVKSIVHEDLALVLRSLRDLVGTEVDRVRIDSRETYQKAQQFARKFVPEVAQRLGYYPGGRPVFDLYNIEDELQRALQREVKLKSGGHLVFDQTEAMTTIDVNTGAFVGHRNLEETIFKTNLEAAQAIARQLRLRNLGGIIIIDFIDMTEEEHKTQVLAALERSLEADHAKSHLSEVSALGLVQMTRKRTRESLEHVLCEVCPTCGGRGSVKTAETVCYEIFREILREARQYESQSLLVLTSQDVVDIMLDDESTSLAELEAFIGKPIKLQVETLYTQEQYDVVLM